MALQSQAQLLDELMGKNRNAGPGIRLNSIRFDDEDVCKYSLCGFCPHDLFVNTRADLGPCDKIHDEELANAYEKSSRYGKLGYEEDFERFIRSLLMDVEKKIKRGVERLKLTQNDPNHRTPSQIRSEKIAVLKEQINEILKEAEALGELGEIDQAQEKLESCEPLKTECKHLEMAEQQAQLIDQKIMEVCDVCGSFLIVNDAQARVEEHVAGKQHMGYAKLRSALEDIRKKRIEEMEKREKERAARREEREKDRHNRSDRNDRTDKYRDRDYDRERDRDRYRRHRSSRSPAKNNSSSSRRDKNIRRSRSRSKNRKNDKRHRTRSRSRDSKHRKSESNGHNKESDELKSNNDSENKLPSVDKVKEDGERDSELDEGEIN